MRSFVYVAETLSFSIAATRCCVTQSAISQHIKALEDELRCKLLIRTSHSIMLTESGEALLPRAKEILKQTDDCKEQINALNNCLVGELRIGVGSFIAPYIRMAALIFMERYPNVRINAEFAKAANLNHLLRNHSIDLAFTLNSAYKNEGIKSEPCIPFCIYAMMRDTHPLARLEKVSYEDLLRHNVSQDFTIPVFSATAITSVSASVGAIQNGIARVACCSCSKTFVCDAPLTLTITATA